MKVKFYHQIEDCALKFAVIVSRYQNKWVFVQHRERETIEIPGGKRELNELIEGCAKRELYEETGAVKFNSKPVCVYSVVRGNDESYGMLYFAEIIEFGALPPSEIRQVILYEDVPTAQWTYPEIQPLLLKHVISQGIVE